MILILYLVKASVVIFGDRGRARARWPRVVGRVASPDCARSPLAACSRCRFSRPSSLSGRSRTSLVRLKPDTTSLPASLAGPAKAGHYVLSASLASPAKAGHYVLPAFPWQLVALVIYGSGVLLLMARLLFDRLRARRLARDTPELNDPEWHTLFRACAGELGVQGPRAAAAQPGAGHAHGDRHPPSSHRRPSLWPTRGLMTCVAPFSSTSLRM